LSEADLDAAQLRQDLITNKVEAALAFTHQLGNLSNVQDSQNPESDPAYLASIRIISGVTEEQGTLESTLAFLDSIHNSDDPIAVINTNMQTTTSVILDTMNIFLIGDAKAKYAMDHITGERRVTDEVQYVGSESLNLENKDDPVTLKSGLFYNLEVSLHTEEAYPEGLNFTFVLIEVTNDEMGDEARVSKTIYSARKEIDEAGEYSFSVNVFVGTDLPAGKYTLAVYALEQQLEEISVLNKKITDVPEIGGLYVEVEKDADTKRIEVVNIEAAKYMDLPYADKFVNGHANKQSGSASLSLVNTSDQKEEVRISAYMELEDGSTINLMILDSNDSAIKNEVYYMIPPFSMGEKETGTYNIHLTYYLPESIYGSLIERLPDMSQQETVDGIKGIVKWNIQSTNSDIKTDENLENQIEVSKYKDNFILSKLATTLQFTLDNLAEQLALDTTDYSWIKNAVFNFPIDAVLDFDNDYAYVFSLNSYAKYDKRKKEIIDGWHDRDGTLSYNGFVFIDPMWRGIPFSKIDAVFKEGDTAYFFSGDKYVRYSLSRKEVIEDEDEDGYGTPTSKISIVNFATGMPFSHVDAAVNDYHGYAYLIDGTQYVKVDLNRHEVVDGIKNVVDKWGDVGEITAALSDSQGKERVTFFDDKEVKTKFLNLGEVLFKYGSEFSQDFGDSSKAALTFDSAYGLKGSWMVPGIHAYAFAKINLDIINHSYSIFNFNVDMEASINKLHPLADDSLLSNVSNKEGATVFLEIVNSKFFDEDTMSETLVTEKIGTSGPLYNDIAEARNILASKNIPIYNDGWNEDKVIFYTIIPVWVVPVEVKMGIKGYFNVSSGLEFDGVSVGMGIHTPFDIETYAEAGVTVVAARVGVKGDIDIMRGGMDASIGCSLKTNLSQDLVYSLDEEIKMNLKLIQAAFSVYAEVWGKIKWCKCCIKYLGCESCPCGVGYYHYSKDIYNTPWLYNNEWTLLEEHQPFIKLPIH